MLNHGYRLSRVALLCLLPMAAMAAKMTFVMVPKNSHAYYQGCYDGFAAAGGYYDVNVEKMDPEASLPLQVKAIHDLIARHVDGIAVAAIDDAGLAPVIAEATQAGIKVVAFDAPAPTSVALSYIGTNNWLAGYEAGARFVRLMQGRGSMVILQAGLNAANLNQRTEGFKAALAKLAPRIKIQEVVDVDPDFATAVSKSEAMLDKYPNLGGFFSVSSQGAPAAASVLVKQHRAGQVKVAGFDDVDATLEAIRNGSIEFSFVQKTFKMGWLSAEALFDATKGEHLQKINYTRCQFVTTANVNHYLADMKKEVVK